METAQRNATLRDVRDLCDIYEIHDEGIRRQLMDLARGSRGRGWWQGADLPPALESLIGMEGAAVTISELQVVTVPGLLQTRAYATAMFDVYLSDDIEGRAAAVDIRMRRQETLRVESPPKLQVVLDEAAFHRVVGGRAVMLEQLSYLIDLVAADLVDLRVVPFAAGAHMAMIGGFTIWSSLRRRVLSAWRPRSPRSYTPNRMDPGASSTSRPWSGNTSRLLSGRAEEHYLVSSLSII